MVGGADIGLAQARHTRGMTKKGKPRSYSLRRPLSWAVGLTALWAFSTWIALEGFRIAALWPPVLALLCIVLTRRVLVSLFLGALGGALMIEEGRLGEALWSLPFRYLLPALESPWKWGALLFTLALGGFAALLEAGGGLRGLFERFMQDRKDARKRLQFSAMGLGLVCFFDGLANSILVGRVSRSLADACRVSRAKLAYIVDSTSSAVACIAFISTWIATQLSLIEEGLQAVGESDRFHPYAVFFASIPLNFYVLFTLLLLGLSVAMDWNPGPMRRFEERARAAKTPPDNGKRLLDASAAPLRTALVPLGILVGGIMVLFYLREARPLWPVTVEKAALSFSSADGPYILLAGSAAAIAAAVALYPRGRGTPPVLPAFIGGVRSLVLPLTVLLFAWMLAGVIAEAGAAQVLGDLLGGNLSPGLLPLAVFLLGALVSFTTGTSWGTMGLLMPLAVPLVFLLGEPPEQAFLLSAVVAAVFSGAVFGDHCSPFSDTTLVASATCGLRPIDHVRTQLPYALTAAAAAAVFGFLPAGTGFLPAYGALLLGGAALAALVTLATMGARR